VKVANECSDHLSKIFLLSLAPTEQRELISEDFTHHQDYDGIVIINLFSK